VHFNEAAVAEKFPAVQIVHVLMFVAPVAFE